MSDNPSFVLRKIENVVYEDRPIPERMYSSPSMTYFPALTYSFA